MSKPKNILGKFDTYAYHHILMVCNSTTAAEALADPTVGVVSYQHPANPQDRYKARQIGKDAKAKYVTLIDGLSDSRYFITDANWTNYIAADPALSKGSLPQSTTMSLDGELRVVEPMGASFLNRLTDICDELDSDPVGLVFVLKTLFIGRNTNGSSEMITSVRPMMFVAIDITAVFDNSGAVYKMEFVGLTNGAGRLPHTQKVSEGVSLQLNYSSLWDTMKALETSVNEKYDSSKNKTIKDYAATFVELENQAALDKAQKFLAENYRDVQYRFILEKDPYKDGRYGAGDNENVRIADGTVAATVNFGADISVEDMISRIMASSIGVLDDSKGIGTKNGPDGRPEKYIYKIISVVRSTPDLYIVEYHIKRYLQAENAYTQQEKDGKITPYPGQSIEFDYIFTDKNVDIKTFDIKMEMGLSFFQIAATSDNIPTQKTAMEGGTSSTVTLGGGPAANPGKKQRGSTPLFLGSVVSKPAMRNTKQPIKSAGFQALLDRHASLENVAANMVIYGNPQLLDEMTILPSEISLPIAQTEDPVADRTVNPRWMSSPTLAKVNIKMPVDANDVNTEYEDFWYTGWYMLQVVENKFEDGVFTQELGMYSIPISDVSREVSDKPPVPFAGGGQTAAEVADEAVAATNTIFEDTFDIITQTPEHKRKQLDNFAMGVNNEFVEKKQ